MLNNIFVLVIWTTLPGLISRTSGKATQILLQSEICSNRIGSIFGMN